MSWFLVSSLILIDLINIYLMTLKSFSLLTNNHSKIWERIHFRPLCVPCFPCKQIESPMPRVKQYIYPGSLCPTESNYIIETKYYCQWDVSASLFWFWSQIQNNLLITIFLVMVLMHFWKVYGRNFLGNNLRKNFRLAFHI